MWGDLLCVMIFLLILSTICSLVLYFSDIFLYVSIDFKPICLEINRIFKHTQLFSTL